MRKGWWAIDFLDIKVIGDFPPFKAILVPSRIWGQGSDMNQSMWRGKILTMRGLKSLIASLLPMFWLCYSRTVALSGSAV